MDKVSKSVISKIKNEKIKPKSKWEFLLKNYIIWSIFILNLILGSLGFAITLYLLSNNDIIDEPTLATNIWQWVILSIPILWIIFTLLFIFIAYIDFKYTQDGYKYNFLKVILINLVVIFVIGFFLNLIGFSEKINTLFYDNIPYYNHTFDMRYSVWMRPEEGYLAGEIIEIDNYNREITISDLNGDKWQVSIADAIIRGRVEIVVNEEIKIIGTKQTGNSFKASEIRPWMMMGGQGMMRNMMQ